MTTGNTHEILPTPENPPTMVLHRFFGPNDNVPPLVPPLEIYLTGETGTTESAIFRQGDRSVFYDGDELRELGNGQMHIGILEVIRTIAESGTSKPKIGTPEPLI